jgi:hypothetical protein
VQQQEGKWRVEEGGADGWVDIDASLRCLGSEFVDLYRKHRCDAATRTREGISWDRRPHPPAPSPGREEQVRGPRYAGRGVIMRKVRHKQKSIFVRPGHPYRRDYESHARRGQGQQSSLHRRLQHVRVAVLQDTVNATIRFAVDLALGEEPDGTLATQLFASVRVPNLPNDTGVLLATGWPARRSPTHPPIAGLRGDLPDQRRFHAA